MGVQWMILSKTWEVLIDLKGSISQDTNGYGMDVLIDLKTKL